MLVGFLVGLFISYLCIVIVLVMFGSWSLDDAIIFFIPKKNIPIETPDRQPVEIVSIKLLEARHDGARFSIEVTYNDETVSYFYKGAVYTGYFCEETHEKVPILSPIVERFDTEVRKVIATSDDDELKSWLW